MIWLKNSRGRPDALLSLLAVGVAVVLVKVLLNGMTFSSWAAGTIDAALATGIIGTLVAAYTTKRVKVDSDKPESKPPPASGFANVFGLVVLVAIGFAIYLFAAHARAAVPCPNPHRSQTVVALFKAEWSAANGGLPCPLSCRTYTRVGRAFMLYDRCGACEVDHIVPLACCGPDTPSNMQWLDKKANRAKGATCPVKP